MPHFLRQIKNFGLNQAIVTQLYRFVIESIVFFGVTVCFGGATSDETEELKCTVTHPGLIIGRDPSITSLYRTQSFAVSQSEHNLW